MLRVAIAMVGVSTGLIAGALLLPHALALSRNDGQESLSASAGVPVVDAAIPAGIVNIDLAPDFRAKLSRELFGAAAVDRSPLRAAGLGLDARPAGGSERPRSPVTAPAEAGGRGATADIPVAPPASSAPAERGPVALAAGISPPPASVRMRPKERPPMLHLAALTDGGSVPAGADSDADGPPAGGVSGNAGVAEVQQQLIARGYAVGPVDGRLGARTIEAIRRYQKASGLAADGRIDAALLARLRGRGGEGPARRPRAAAASGSLPEEAAPVTLSHRVLGGVQRLIGPDHDSRLSPDDLAGYCRERPDEWIYDGGQKRLRLCADITGGRVAYRPLPGDR